MKNFFLVICVVMILSFVSFAAVNDQANMVSSTQGKQLLKSASDFSEKSGVDYNFYFINSEAELQKATNMASKTSRLVTMIFYKISNSKVKVSVLVSNDIDLSDYSSEINDSLSSIKLQIQKKEYFEGASSLLENVASIVETGENEKKIEKIETTHVGGKVFGLQFLEWVVGIIIIIFLLILIRRYFIARKSTQCKFCKIPMHMILGDFNNPNISREYECKICGFKRKFIKK